MLPYRQASAIACAFFRAYRFIAKTLSLLRRRPPYRHIIMQQGCIMQKF